MLHKFLKIINHNSRSGFTNAESPQEGTSSSFSDIFLFSGTRMNSIKNLNSIQLDGGGRGAGTKRRAKINSLRFCLHYQMSATNE